MNVTLQVNAVHEAIVLSVGRMINDLGGTIATLLCRTDQLDSTQQKLVARMRDSLQQLGQPHN